MDERERWNAAADHFQKVRHETNGGYPEQLIDFLRERGALQQDFRIADIGCGAGKYAEIFAKNGNDLLLMDLSDRMMQYTLQNLQGYNIQMESFVGDWSGVDTQSGQWKKQVDLAFASMTPAVASLEDVQKMCELSRRFCFISHFAYRRNSLREAVCAACGEENDGSKELAAECVNLVQWIVQMGYYPELRFVDYCWENQLSIEEAYRQCFEGFAWLKDDENTRKKARRVLENVCGADGIILETVTAKAAWIFWDVTRT